MIGSRMSLLKILKAMQNKEMRRQLFESVGGLFGSEITTTKDLLYTWKLNAAVQAR